MGGGVLRYIWLGPFFGFRILKFNIFLHWDMKKLWIMFWSLLYWTNLGVGEWDALGSQNFKYLFAMVDIYLGMPDIPERTHGRNDSVPNDPPKQAKSKPQILAETTWIHTVHMPIMQVRASGRKKKRVVVDIINEIGRNLLI